jgi:hypothetical protein
MWPLQATLSIKKRFRILHRTPASMGRLHRIFPTEGSGGAARPCLHGGGIVAPVHRL